MYRSLLTCIVSYIIMLLKNIYLEIKDFFQQLNINKRLIYELTIRDFTSKYIKNFFGLSWAILDPLAFVLVLYFVFGMRFGDREASGYPYIVYLITGYMAYDFFSQAIRQLSNSIKSYSFMIKKVNFRLAILPIVKLLSGLMMHAIILVIVFVILFSNSVYPGWHWFQLLYYIFALSVLLLGIGWFNSSVSLFFPDILNITNIIVRLQFFLTPIFWNTEGLPESYVFILKFNPLFYIVSGYRESLIYNIPFWEHPVLTLYYWGFTLITLIAGIIVFKRLRPHFADVV